MNSLLKKTLLGILFFGNLALIYFFWWTGSGSLVKSGDSAELFIALGRLSGLIAQFFILVQLVLIGRIRVVERLFGFDKLNRYHRWIGYSWAFLIIFHPLLLTLGYARIGGVSYSEQFMKFMTSWEDVFKALLGLIILFIAIGISIAIIRKRLRYETWYFTHLLIYLAITLTFGHQLNSGDFVNKNLVMYWYVLNFIIFGLVLVYRFVRPLYMALKFDFRIEKIVKENQSVTSVYITGKNIQNFQYEAGQYSHLTFLQKGMWFTHPFSFSKAPNSQHIRLSIKSLGDFTSKIEKLQPGTRVIIDGPFGVFTERMARTKKFLFIAGGIGITPVYSLIDSMKDRGYDSILLYGNRTLNESVFSEELASMNVKVINVLSGEVVPNMESGFVDKEKIVRLAPDVVTRDVYVCGPPVMMANVVKALTEIGVPNKQIHYERFAY